MLPQNLLRWHCIRSSVRPPHRISGADTTAGKALLVAPEGRGADGVDTMAQWDDTTTMIVTTTTAGKTSCKLPCKVEFMHFITWLAVAVTAE
jgi:hypothetical protein